MKAILKKMRKFCGAGFLGLIIAFFAGCSREINHSENLLRVGMECSYAPFNWIQPNSSGGAVEISGGWYAGGYDVYMAKKICELTNRKLEIVKVDWDGLLPALSSGKIDAVIAGMSATAERKHTIDFTNNYYDSNIVVVVKKNGKFSNASCLENLKGAKLTGQMSTVHYTLIDQINGVDKQVPLEDFSSMISAVNAGKIDGYISEKPAALTAVSTNPGLTYLEFEKDKGFEFSQDDVAIAIGVRKGSALREEINTALEHISEETRERLMKEAVEFSRVK